MSIISLIKTNFRNTISMTLDSGNMFAESDASLEVRNIKTERYLGFITSEYFRDNRYQRTTSDGQIIWVCPFQKD